MKRSHSIKLLFCLVLVIFLVGCGKEAPMVAPEPVVPVEVPEVPAEVPDEVEAEDEVPADLITPPVGDEEILFRIDAESGRVIQGVSCDATNNVFKVTLINPLDRAFSLKRLSSLAASSAGLEILTPSVNGGIINNMDELCGQDILEPGETVTCEKSFTPNTNKKKFLIRTGSDDLGKTLINYLRIKTTKGHHEVRFKCI